MNLDSDFRFNLTSLAAAFSTDDDHTTPSSLAQEDVEGDVLAVYKRALIGSALRSRQSSHASSDSPPDDAPAPHPLTLHRDRHRAYLTRATQSLSSGMTSLSASRPWLVYWLLHAQDLLTRGDPLPESLRLRAATTVLRFQQPGGGFGGGVGQRAHLAATYAAVHALGLTRDAQAWERVDRVAMYRFLMRCKQPDGSFVVCDGGEVDLRGTYCALTVARLLNIVTPELTANCIDFIARCQSHDGGLAAVPHTEAHGGYTFCGLAAALLLNQSHLLDLDALLAWSIRRQMPLEGGFQGRPNKLVDGCYSWWVGGVFELLDAAFVLRDRQEAREAANEGVMRPSMAWNRQALQEYILLACQAERGGLIDKPGKYPDPYHTCYVLSGLAAAQFAYEVVADEGLGGQVKFVSREGEVCVVGPVDNLLHPVDPIHNVRPDVVEDMGRFFRERPLDERTLKGE